MDYLKASDTQLVCRRARQRTAQGDSAQAQPDSADGPAQLHGAGDHAIAELAELFSISRATVYREIARTPAKKSVAAVR